MSYWPGLRLVSEARVKYYKFRAFTSLIYFMSYLLDDFQITNLALPWLYPAQLSSSSWLQNVPVPARLNQCYQTGELRITPFGQD